MTDFSLRVDLTEVNGAVEQMQENLTGGKVAAFMAEIADELEQSSEEAFSQKRNPRSLEPWEGAAYETLRSRGFRSLLVRTGALERAVRARSEASGSHGRALLEFIGPQDVVSRGFMHLFGVVARQKRVRGYRKGKAYYSKRARPGQAMPARGFVGLSDRQVKGVLRKAHELVTEGVT
jgi:phage gpG-like protein